VLRAPVTLVLRATLPVPQLIRERSTLSRALTKRCSRWPVPPTPLKSRKRSRGPRRSPYVLTYTLLWAAAFLARPAQAGAHDPGLSAVELRVEPGALFAHLTFARQDIETLIRIDVNADGRITPAELDASREPLQALARRALDIRFGTHVIEPADLEIELDESAAVHFRLSFTTPPGARLQIRSTLLPALARGHRQYLSAQNAAGKQLAETILEASHARMDIQAAEVAGGHGRDTFQNFLGLGVEHILTGYDHLAFLLAVLLVGGGFGTIARIITSFTLAHSITLALATFNVVRIPPAVVEPLIAGSIVYVGLENLLNRRPRRRWLLTFAFGLVHGLGFASVLNDLGVGTGSADPAVPLVSFNLGVEAGQFGIAVLLLPLIWKLRQKPALATRLLPACSVVVATGGAYWLVQRTLLA
jgi:hydrogenase/urease accessory protein HupE